MKWPRMTLRSLMLVIAVLAVNGGLIRACFTIGDKRGGVLYGLFFAIDFLLIASLRRWILGPGPRDRFWLTSLVAGWWGIAVVAIALLSGERETSLGERVIDALMRPLAAVLDHLLPGFDSGPPSILLVCFLVGLGSVYLNAAFSGTVLGLATLAGWAAVRFGIDVDGFLTRPISPTPHKRSDDQAS